MLMLNLNIKKTEFFLFCLILMSVLFYPGIAICDEIEVEHKFFITAKETYDTNIFYSAEDAVDDFFTSITPSYELNINSERCKIGANASSEIKKYSEEDYLDTASDRYDLNTGLSFKYDPSEFFQIQLETSYVKDTTIDSELEYSGLAIDDKDIFHIKPSITWWVSELNLIRLNLEYLNNQYDNPNYMDYDYYSGIFELGHAISSEKAIVYIGAGGGYADGDRSKRTDNIPTEGGSVKNFGMILGFDLYFNPQWILSARGGAMQMEIEYEPYLFVTEPDIGFVYNEEHRTKTGYLNLKRLYEKGSAYAGIRREMIPSGTDIAINKITAEAFASYDFTDRLSGDIVCALSTSESLSEYIQYFNIDQELYSITTTVKYSLREKINLKISYYRSKSNDKFNNTKPIRNKVYIEFAAEL